MRCYHNKYVEAEGNGRANANSDTVDGWEIEDIGGNKIALWNPQHGKYLVAESNKEINANSDNRGTRETFTVEAQQGGKIAMKTSFGYYLVAESGGRLRADRTRVGGWEQFLPECLGKHKKRI